MPTIRRHPVPTDSYDPNRPLNDLLVAQFEHFKHIATKLPPELAAGVPAAPAAEDREAVGRFIAAITKAHVSRKKELPRLVKPVRRMQPGTVALAAAAKDVPKPSRGKKPARRTKSRPKR